MSNRDGAIQYPRQIIHHSGTELDELIAGFKKLNGGLEHQVFFIKRTGRVFKITKPPHFDHAWYLKDYVQNLIWCNRVFGDDMRLEGVISTHDGGAVVISQPYVIGSSPSEDEVDEWFHLHLASPILRSGTSQRLSHHTKLRLRWESRALVMATAGFGGRMALIVFAAWTISSNMHSFSPTGSEARCRRHASFLEVI